MLGASALVVAALLLVGGQGTFAYWTDSDAVNGSNFSAGKLDLTVDAAQGNPTAYAKTDLTLSAMVPGESVSSNLVLRNAGDADFTWTASASTGGALGPALRVELYTGGAVPADDPTYPREETCSGTLLSTTTATRLNVAGAAQNLCVKVSLPSTTGDAFQGASTGSVTITLNATQVIA